MKRLLLIGVIALFTAPLSIGLYWVYDFKTGLDNSHIGNILTMIPIPDLESMDNMDREMYERHPTPNYYRKLIKMYVLWFRGGPKDIEILKEKMGIAALFYVESKDHAKYEVAEFLMNKGLDINQPTGNMIIGPDTALEVAIWRNNPDDVKWLLSKGASTEFGGRSCTLSEPGGPTEDPDRTHTDALGFAKWIGRDKEDDPFDRPEDLSEIIEILTDHQSESEL